MDNGSQEEMNTSQRAGRLFTILVTAITLSFRVGQAQQLPQVNAEQRRVALTFDQLPAASSMRPDISTARHIVAKLIAALHAEKAPATGFVSEKNLRVRADVDMRRVALLELWLDAGLQIGNSTYSHLDLNSTDRERFQEDVIRGEEISSGLLSRRQQELRYFRYPFYHTGRTKVDRTMFVQFLTQRGYSVIPVTMDASDWQFSTAYDRALSRGDSTLMLRIGESFVRHIEHTFTSCEQASVRVLGREPCQILALGANALTADYLVSILDAAQHRGYRLVSVEEALQDSLYRLPDANPSSQSNSALLRWAESRGISTNGCAPIPPPPVFVAQEAEPK